MRRIYHEALDSTNLEARRLWRRTCEEGECSRDPLLLVAGRQSAGQGRSGRAWSSPPGGLWMSLAWPLHGGLERYRALPLVVGLGTARALEEAFGLACRIKWPNDILVEGRKLAGILCQAEVQGESALIVAGIGINGNYPAATLGGELRLPPTSLLDLVGAPVDLRMLEDTVVKHLLEQLDAFEPAGLVEGILADLRHRLAWLGEPVICSEPGGRVLAQGILRGIGEDGEVLIEGPAGPFPPLAVGELHLSSAAPSAG